MQLYHHMPMIFPTTGFDSVVINTLFLENPTYSCPYATCVSTRYFLAFLCVHLRVSAASKSAMACLYLSLLANLSSGTNQSQHGVIQ